MYSQGSHGARPKATLESQQMCPAGMETGSTGVRLAFGASAQSSGSMGVSSHPPPPCPPSGMHVVQPPGTDVQSMCAMAQNPATQGDQVVGHTWVHIPSTVSGLFSISLTPDGGQGDFMTEARGTSHVISVTPVASPVTGTSTPSAGQPSHGSNVSAESKSKRPLFKLDKFDGSTSLDTFLWKFNQLADYMHWEEQDKFINLCSSLYGPAGQVLRELPTKGTTTAELEELIQTRFGTSKQAASFEAILRARRRQENETLQELHRDISRLVQLAFPNEPGSFLALEGRNAFLNALDDGDLEYEVLKLQPKTLSDAVDHTIRLESLAKLVRSRSHTTTEKAGGRAQRQRNILAVTDKKEPKDESVELQQRVAQLEQQLKQVTQGGTRSAPNSYKKSDSSRRSRGRRSAGQNSDAVAAGTNKPSPQTHLCTVLTVNANMSLTKIYVTAEINGQSVKCLLDSGCERSVISADPAPNASLNPSQYTLFAANKANLDVLGDTVLPCVIDGHAFEADVSVCSKVEDFLLGSDWLEQQGAQWDFASGTVTLGDRCIKVHRRHQTGICRHVAVATDCIVPAKHEANVLVRMEDDGLPLPPYDSAIEPQGLGPNVMTAHTVFSDSQP